MITIRARLTRDEFLTVLTVLKHAVDNTVVEDVLTLFIKEQLECLYNRLHPKKFTIKNKITISMSIAATYSFMSTVGILLPTMGTYERAVWIGLCEQLQRQISREVQMRLFYNGQSN